MRKKINSLKLNDELNKKLLTVENLVSPSLKRTYSFKGRKSSIIIEKTIELLTDENAKIFDPFLGSGSSIIACTTTERNLIATEIDNFTYNIDKVIFEKIDFNKLNKQLLIIEQLCKNQIYELYETTCCGEKNYIKKVLFDPIEGKDGYFSPKPNREIIKGKNIKLINKCSICGGKSKVFENDDWKKIKEISLLDVSNFPNDKLIQNSRINITSSTGADYYSTFFSHRNKRALLLLQEAISRLEPSGEKNFLQYCLVASLSLAKIAMYGSSTDILYHVVLNGAQDMNVWYLFENRVSQFKNFQKNNSTALSDDFTNNSKYKILNMDYRDYLTKNPNEMFDAIFTDFPYTDQVPYLERNQLFRIWLKHFSETPEKYDLTSDMLSKEIVVTDAPSRKDKKLDNYLTDIDKMFYEFSNHLIDYAPVVIFTKLGKKKYFNIFTKIIDLARKNGFEYVSRIGIEKNDPTLRKQSAYRNTLINEVIIIFRKLPSEKRYLYVGGINYESIIIDEVYKKIKSVRDVSYTLTAAVSSIKHDLFSRGVQWDSAIEEKVVNIIIENFHILENQDIQLDKTRLYLDQEDQDTLFNKLYELVPFYVSRLIEKKGKFVIEDLYVELIDELSDGNNRVIYDLLTNDDNIKAIDQLVFDKTDTDGKYYIKKEMPKDFSANAVDIATMDPYEFENLCKTLLENENFVNVHRKGGSGDLGVDIVAEQFTGNKKEFWLVQCKRWVSNVDATPIQRLNSERERLGADKLACFTTSGYTKDARMVAKAHNVELIDGFELVLRLNQYFPGMYYNSNI